MRRLLFILVIAFVGNSATLWAQGPMARVAALAPAAPFESESSAVRLLVGRSTVVDVGTAIARVSLTSADIADALVTAPNQLLVHGKTPGTISMFVWDRTGGIRRYELVVQRDLSRLGEQLQQLFPGESIGVQSNGRDIVLSGRVSSKDIADKAVSLAAGYVDKREEVVSLLQLQPGATNQVLLRVRFAEVSRNALTELGASFFTGPNGYKDVIGRSATQQYSAPIFDDKGTNGNRLVFSDFLNLFLFDMKHQLGTVIKALQTKGLFQSLAEPNLVAESGKEASFLAGGEFPIPVAQGAGTNIAISVQFKEFGVRLNFTPLVEGDRVHLKVRPEVSTLDFANAVVLNGFRIPALSTRRTETEVELQDGQTFAIAGLLNNTMTKSLQKIPGIGDIPILGLLFRSEAAQKDRTELVVMITPQILTRSSAGVTSDLPRLAEPYLAPLPQKRQIEPPPPAFRSPQGAATTPPAPVAASPAPPAAPAASAVDAARTVSALTPGAPKVIQAAPSAAPAVAPKKLTRDEEKALEEARRQEQEQAKAARAAEIKSAAKQAEQEREQVKADERAKAAEAKLLAKQAKEERRKAEEQRKLQERLDRAQAKRDVEAAKREAKLAKQAAKEAKRAAEAAKRQAEIDRRQRQAIEEAAARLKAAEAAYQAQVAGRNKPEPQ